LGWEGKGGNESVRILAFTFEIYMSNTQKTWWLAATVAENYKKFMTVDFEWSNQKGELYVYIKQLLIMPKLSEYTNHIKPFSGIFHSQKTHI